MHVRDVCILAGQPAGHTALLIAAKLGDVVSVRALLDRGANVNHASLVDVSGACLSLPVCGRLVGMRVGASVGVCYGVWMCVCVCACARVRVRVCVCACVRVCGACWNVCVGRVRVC